MPVKIYVTHKACAECFLMPGRTNPFTREEVRELLADLDEDDSIMECPVVTLARRHGLSGIPEEGTTCCFGYYYFRGRQNKYLRAAIEEGKIEYVDITGWPTLSESQMEIYRSEFGESQPWEHYPESAELQKWKGEVEKRQGKSGNLWEPSVE